jgi:hypothetical protein
VADSHGLELNLSKCEIVSKSDSAVATVLNSHPGMKRVALDEVELLGSPLGKKSAKVLLDKQINTLRVFRSRLVSLHPHDAFFLLRNCLSLPKFLCLLRTAPCFQHSAELESFDKVVRETLCTVLNIDLDDSQWRQASLPVRYGGIGVRSAMDIATCAFMSSFTSTAKLRAAILSPEEFVMNSDLLAAVQKWSNLANREAPPMNTALQQSQLDKAITESNVAQLQSEANSQIVKARLVACSTKGSGAWLNAVPNNQLGLKLLPQQLRVAMALRLGARTQAAQTCRCGALVDTSGVHHLSCRFSAGRHSRHHEVNDLIKRALGTAQIPAIREPDGLAASLRPDGVTLIPWREGKLMAWDYTCCDSLAPSHLNATVSASSTAACAAEERKKAKYASLDNGYIFIPIASETLGGWGPTATLFLKKLGSLLNEQTRNPRSSEFLMQRLSMAIQRGNATSLIVAQPCGPGLPELSEL